VRAEHDQHRHAARDREAAIVDGAGAPIVRAILERRQVVLPSWSDGVPGS